MSNIKITASQLNGTVSVPPSKSAAHRAIICACLAKGVSVIEPVELSNDIQATINCVKALGADISLVGKKLTINGENTLSAKGSVLDCGESGSTLRFLIPVSAVEDTGCTFVGHGRLPERPIGIYLDCLPRAGVKCTTEGGLPLTIDGKLSSGIFEIPGNVSSQFITGLLLALPMLDGDSEIILTSDLESVGYINMTIDIMSEFGVKIESTAKGYFIKGNQQYSPCRFTVEGDWSQAAFFLAAGALGGHVSVDNLDVNSAQGDKECARLLSMFGADIVVDGANVSAKHNKLKGINIDAANIPDLVPILATVAAFCEGTTTITGAARLRIKESDRLTAIAQGLNALGADIKELDDGLVINGVEKLKGGDVEGFNDHRIVMALAIAATNSSEPVIITDRESINKSYPTFFEDYKSLGGNADVIGMG